MHVGLVIRRLIGRNGEEQGTAELAVELARRGVAVTVLSAGPAHAPADQSFAAVNLGVGRLDSRRAWGRFAEAVRAEAAARRVDLLHSMGPMLDCDVYQPRGGAIAETFARYAAMPRPWLDRLRVRLRMATSPSIRAKLRLEREFFARRPLPLIVAMSDYVADQLRRHHGVPDDRLRTVFGAVQISPPHPDKRAMLRTNLRGRLGVSPATTLLLFVAQQFRQKGLGYLIEAAARSAGEAPLAVAVIGRDDPAPYRRQAQRLGLGEAMHWLGPLDVEQVRQWYPAADALVLPTIFDACSRTALESLAMGAPVITTAHNGAGELLVQSGAGLRVGDAWDIAGLAGAITQARDPAVRGRWAESAGQLAQFVTVGRMAGQLIEIYNALPPRATRRAGAL